MKLRDIHSAKGLKFKLKCADGDSANFSANQLISITSASTQNAYFVEPFGLEKHILTTDNITSQYLNDLISSENQGVFHCLYEVEAISNNCLEIQSYIFRSFTEYKTPITIKITDEVLEKNKRKLEDIKQLFVWTGFNQPAIFSLSYKDSVKRKADIRLLSDKLFLKAKNTARGIICTEISYIKDKTDLPIDVYVAPEIQFVDQSSIDIVNDDLSADLEKISNAATYFARWDAYNTLAKKQIENNAYEFGTIPFSAVKKFIGVDGTTYEFSIKDEISRDYYNSDIAILSEAEPEENKQYFRDNKTNVGTITKIEHNKLVTYKVDNDNVTYVPSEGCLVLNTKGDESIIKRRDMAKVRMLSGRSPIKSIVRLIEEGVSEYSITGWGDSKDITDRLCRNFPKAKDLNDMQRKALDTAINSPDIAIIQGPPGTGKTTVIKAICERFREIYEAKERQNQKQNEDYVVSRPKILISSFQNEAVDNAVSKPLQGDMPAYRLSRKGSIKAQYQKNLELWLDEAQNQIKSGIDNSALLNFVEKKRTLLDRYLSYKNAGERIEDAVSLIKDYLSFEDITYPDELNKLANSIISAYNKSQLIGEIEEDPVVAKLASQRLTKAAFSDDGIANAKRLASHLSIREDLPITNEDIDVIQAVCKEPFLEAEYTKYVDVCKSLIRRFCSQDMQLDLSQKGKIDECLLSLAHCFSAGFINSIDDIEARKALIVGEFIERLSNEYESLVGKYSLTTAATCQTCLQMDNPDETYDLVIIDEAARANPLDLFIPMSMGRKIVLVGDHKQLPHMLEPDVLRLILEDDKYKDLPGIDISLFERLFDMFSSAKRSKSVMLSQQYRMHPDICQFVSESFYDGVLKTAPQITKELRKSSNNVHKGKPLTFIDIQKTHGREEAGKSKFRPIEVKVIFDDVKTILSSEPAATIGIITFYSAQEKRLREKSGEAGLNEEQLSQIEIGTVDAFQGKEFDYVLLSCVRANDVIRDAETKAVIENEETTKARVGFLMKPNRLCVAFSRARKQLAVYGDSDTLKLVPCFNSLYNLCKNTDGGYYYEY